MENKTKLIIDGACLLIVILGIVAIYFWPQAEDIDNSYNIAKDSLDKFGIVQMTDASVKSDTIIIEMYSKNKCLDQIKKNFEDLDSVSIQDVKGKDVLPQDLVSLGLEEPILILKIDSQRKIITGPIACVDKLVTTIICESLNNPPQMCGSDMYPKTIVDDSDFERSDDKECYQPCVIEYEQNNLILTQLWSGPPCSRIPGYDDSYNIIFRKCLDDSCKDEPVDRACCSRHNCVSQGECHLPGDLLNIDSQNQICTFSENESIWANPDRDNVTCSLGKFEWLDCNPSSECKNAIDNYDFKDNGLCCGDDPEELITICLGEVCDDQEKVCCNENECAFKSACYSSGCHELEIEEGLINSFCDGEKWIDLDDANCEKCLGKKSWTGSFCCGDDLGEGKTATKLIVHSEDQSIFEPFYCSDRKSSCNINGDWKREGCLAMSFPNQETTKFYCEKGEFYDVEQKSDYCQKCGFGWFESNIKNQCCGDEKDEFFVEGNDGTVACCSSNISYVVNGLCSESAICGDDVKSNSEECESPETLNNVYCPQLIEECQNGKVGMRDKTGNCNSACTCTYDIYKYSCKRGKCGAQCSDNADCESNSFCSQTDCRCYGSSDNVTKNCPDKIILELNQDMYAVNDVIEALVKVYDRFNNPIPNAKYTADIMINDILIGTAIYRTGYTGSHVSKKTVTSSSVPGNLTYTVRALESDCETRGDKKSVNLISGINTEKFQISRRLSSQKFGILHLQLNQNQYAVMI